MPSFNPMSYLDLERCWFATNCDKLAEAICKGEDDPFTASARKLVSGVIAVKADKNGKTKTLRRAPVNEK